MIDLRLRQHKTSVLALLLWGLASAPLGARAADDAAAKLFQTKCVACHAADGSGNTTAIQWDRTAEGFSQTANGIASKAAFNDAYDSYGNLSFRYGASGSWAKRAFDYVVSNLVVAASLGDSEESALK